MFMLSLWRLDRRIQDLKNGLSRSPITRETAQLNAALARSLIRTTWLYRVLQPKTWSRFFTGGINPPPSTDTTDPSTPLGSFDFGKTV